MNYYKRDIEKVIKSAAGKFRVVGLTGARQTGKSTLLRHIFSKTHKYVCLDSPRDLKLALEDPELFFQQYRPPLVIDEIQYAPQLLKYIKIIVDSSNKPGQLILTGSQKFMLMKGLQESLAGRIALFDLYPFGIFEGPLASQNYKFRALNGSYPENFRIKNTDTSDWFGSYLSTYIERDVEYNFHLEKIEVFKDFVFLLAARTAQILNYQSFSNDLGVSVHAIKTWIKILEASGIIYLLRPFFVNLGSRIVKSPKVYFTDVGLVNYLIGNADEKALLRGPQAGAIFENFVIQELLKLYTNRGKRPQLYYYRTNNGLEVDLLIQENIGSIIPCEIKLTKTPQAAMAGSMERLRALNKKKDFIIKDGAVICMTDKSFALTRRDKAYNFKDFLSQC